MAGTGQFPMSSQSSLPSSMMSSQAAMAGGMMSSQGIGSSYGQPVYSQSPSVSMAGLQHQQSYPGPPPAPPPAQQQQMMSPTKTVNYVSLCKMGQETNQELVNKLLDVFRLFKAMQVLIDCLGLENSSLPARHLMYQNVTQSALLNRK